MVVPVTKTASEVLTNSSVRVRPSQISTPNLSETILSEFKSVILTPSGPKAATEVLGDCGIKANEADKLRPGFLQNLSLALLIHNLSVSDITCRLLF